MTLSDSLTEYFYRWEGRGRGGHLCERRVHLEPPYEPFLPEQAIMRSSIRPDDGLHPMPITQLFSWVGNLFTTKQKTPVVSQTPKIREDDTSTPLCFLSVSLSRDIDLTGYEAEQLLLMLSYCESPISFEIVGSHDRMRLQFTCGESDASYVTSQFEAFYPGCSIVEGEDALYSVPFPSLDTVMLDFGLTQEFMRPLASYDSGAPSPYMGLSGIFSALGHGEHACLQVLFKGAVKPWAGSIMRSVTDANGDSFFENDKDMPRLAAQKTASQLFAVSLRAFVATSSQYASDMAMRHLAHALTNLTRSEHNSLAPLSADTYSGIDHFDDIVSRKSRRPGMLLNTGELALMVHLPDEKTLVGKISSDLRRTRALPDASKGHDHWLGANVHQNVEQIATVGEGDRFTHMHVIGATGTGKSTFLLNGIAQDIQNGRGVAVLDPHGDLIEATLKLIPEHRRQDAIVIDPSDAEYSVGFNIISANSELEKEVLSSDLVSMFQKFSTSWGDQMNSVLANTLLAFLENTERGTLLDVRRFLLETRFREQVLKTATDQSVIYYWKKEFPVIKGNAVGSILTRLDSFLRPKAIRYMVGQRQGLDFNDILNNQKILLVKLSHGLIGESNSYLLGSLIVSKIYQTALSRQSIPKEGRKGFYVYIDEFQHFITPSLSHILSGGRKYGVGLILAHQSLEQISKTDAELAASLIANAGVRVCFRLGESDAQRLEKGFSSFTGQDLLTLGTGEAICRIGRSDMDFNLSVPKEGFHDKSGLRSAEDVIEASRKRYAVLRASLGEALNPRADFNEEEPPAQAVAPRREEAPKDDAKQAEKKRVSVESNSEIRVIDNPQLAEGIVRRKEESRHKYLQLLIKRNAESRGYRAVLEQQTKDGKGRVDIVLQKDNVVLAVEVGVTTTKDWEVHNIEKCLSDGYAAIIALSEDERGADLMTRKLTERGVLPRASDKVRVMDLVGFLGLLNKEETKSHTKVRTVKGYRVRVEYGEK